MSYPISMIFHADILKTYFFIPVSRLKSYENMPLYSFPKAWSLLTDHSITIIRNRDEFNVKLKEYFLAKLSFTVICTKAFCHRFLNS